ncbi:mitochondrial 54S ribosomal protein mL53 TDEL_0B03600 [Torulaspora delbrueckii]|uniref:Large ribosomal subunit protein mL53 n=1 Tax=Torulaspora delbrueckii TaxID=4950 RepID=G8ZPE5_TORDE|nr:mitochondrial 54S ribosomal protein YmL44 [Torulaspora delbrueckii]CCE90489.1 hypothetical protein TDEL_0B03600 [Torulaspora delbrueckii]
MITKYFSKVVVKFNPFGKEAKTARLLLSSIPPAQRLQGTQIQSEILHASSSKTPIVKITYKDKKEMELDPSTVTFQELASYFDRHSRQLKLKESIENS